MPDSAEIEITEEVWHNVPNRRNKEIFRTLCSNHQKKSPPTWATKFLRWFCSEYYRNEVEGDLLEVFRIRLEKNGLWKARYLYIRDVIRFFFKPYIMKSNFFSRSNDNDPNQIALFKNHFTSSYRSLLKNKLFTFINVIGLAIGFTCTILISLFVYDELSYDNFFDEAEKIYRVSLHNE